MTSDAQILAPPAAAGEGADPRRWLTLTILLLAAFMNLLDVSIVNIAIPSIQRDLNASYADVQWALAGYTLAYALVLITGGRLGDTFGRKRMFLIGVSGFTIMSALCGAAQTPGQLIAFRVVQGAMGAIMVWLVSFASSSLAGVPLLFHEGWSMGELRQMAKAEERAGEAALLEEAEQGVNPEKGAP